MRYQHLGAALLCLSLTATATSQPSAGGTLASPHLVVLLVVDQMRADYFARFGPQFTGGFRRLLDRGAIFTDAHQDHAITETGPGHASTLSGRFPQHTGIVTNQTGVPDSQAPLLTSADPGASPFRFRGSTLIDWLRNKNPDSRALSVSRKDRGAILPLGRAKQAVFWYAASSGEFTTSRYYADTLADWIKRVNARRVPQHAAGRSWTLLLPASAYPEPDSVPVENGGRDYRFPHSLSTDSARAALEFIATPWLDLLTLELALEGVTALNLGSGPAPDLLVVSLSGTDYVGHRYGMDSRELHDQMLRLDLGLGGFLDSLFRLRDSSGIIIALTADHGMTPYPELHFSGTDPARGRADIFPALTSQIQRLAMKGVDPAAVGFEAGAILFDSLAFARAGVNRDSAARAMAAELRGVPGVLEADLREDLAGKAAAGNRYARRWLHMLPDDLPAVVLVTLQPYYYWAGTTYPTHGSPHDSDTNVPLVFFGPPFKPGKYGEFVRVVDLAPTLAAVLGVAPTEPLDGRVLRQALR